MRQYLSLLKRIQRKGVFKGDRTGTGTQSLFGHQMRFDLEKGFPLLTTKKLFVKGIIYELLWMLKGNTNIEYLNDHGVYIWNEWANEDGDLGPVYGKQWRSWPAPKKVWRSTGDVMYGDPNEGYWEYVPNDIDQITNIVEGIKKNPDSRRHIVSAWNVADLDDMALSPCHCLFQFWVADGKLSCQLYQRSADVFLGVPFNIASYSLLTMMIAQVCDLKVGDFIHTFGDVHIYNNHQEQVALQLTRNPRKLPIMRFDPSVKKINDFVFDDFTLENYNPHPAIKGDVSV